MQNSVSMLDYLFVKNGIALEMRKTDGPLRIMGHSRLRGFVIMNIVLNAVHAINGNAGRISVSIEKVNSHGISKICDNGTGISREKIERIRNPFTSLDKTQNGYGLGLAASRAIVEDHGGGIQVKS